MSESFPSAIWGRSRTCALCATGHHAGAAIHQSTRDNLSSTLKEISADADGGGSEPAVFPKSVLPQFLSDLLSGFLWVATRLPDYESIQTSGVDTTRHLSTFTTKCRFGCGSVLCRASGGRCCSAVPGEHNARFLRGLLLAEPGILGELEGKVPQTWPPSLKCQTCQFPALFL